MNFTEQDLEEQGHYSSNDKKFFNKYEAIEEALRTSKSIAFHFNDAFWGKQNWKEPVKLSLKELYKKRAEQLRSKYNYIVLCYSGGADSWNVLKAFEDNNIHLDEIASWHDYSLSHSEDSKANAEVFKVAVPEAKKYIEKHPNTIHRLVDIKQSIFSAYETLDSDQRFMSYFQSSFSIASPLRGISWAYEIEHYRKLVEAGKTVCLLQGYDKVILGLQKADNRYYFWFHDLMIKSNRKKFLNPELPFHDEFFYWSPDAADMLIAQCHELKTRLDSLPLKYLDPHPITIVPEKICYITNKRGAKISFETINYWLYGWDPFTFSVGKPKSSLFFSELDFWAKNYLNEDVVKIWLKDLERCTDYYKKIRFKHRGDNNHYFGFHPGMNTRRYYVD